MVDTSSAQSVVSSRRWVCRLATSWYGTPTISLVLFAFLLVVFVTSPLMISTDSRWSIHTAMSLARGHGGDLTEYFPILQKEKFYSIEYPDGRPRTLYPIGPSLLAMPIVEALAWVRPDWAAGLPYNIPRRTQELIASLIGAIAGVIFYWLILSEFQSQAIALASAAILSLCTSMWSTATRALWQHGPLVLMLVIAMLLLERARRRTELVQYVGLPLAMSYLMRPTAIVAVIVLSTYVVVFYRAYFVQFICWAMLVTIPWMTYNFTIYHQLLPHYYSMNAFSTQTRFLEGLLGNLFSPSRGLFVFSPVLTFALSGFIFALRDRERGALHLAYGAIVAGNMIVIGSASMWWAGHSFGPRFTTDVVPFLAYFTAFNFRLPESFQHRTQVVVSSAIVVLALVSMAIHEQGSFRHATWEWNYIPNNIDQNPAREWDWRDPQFARVHQ